MVYSSPLQSLQTNATDFQLEKRQLVSPGAAQAEFADKLKNAIQTLNNSQIESDMKTEQLAKGEIDNLHDVMITAQKASITLTTAVEMQKKAIDAYSEIMRIQI